MNPRLPALLLGVGIAALLAAAVVAIGLPTVISVVFGLPLVFVLPGFAATFAALPGRELSWGERALASVGVSLAISIVVSVLLAATPIGLSRGSAAAVLGVSTAAVAFWARTRNRQFLDEKHDESSYR
jgi:uncharacterized membrane protein